MVSSSGSRHCSLLRASIYEGPPSGAADQYRGGEGDGVLTMESVQETKEEKSSDEVLLTEALKEDSEIVPTEALKEESQVDVKTLAFEFLDNLNIKVCSTLCYLIYAFLWL